MSSGFRFQFDSKVSFETIYLSPGLRDSHNKILAYLWHKLQTAAFAVESLAYSEAFRSYTFSLETRDKLLGLKLNADARQPRENRAV